MHSPQPPILRCLEVSKRYGQVQALNQLSLIVDTPIFGLLGANGAGKSTLFKAILDLVALDSGVIEVDGLAVHQHSLTVRRRLGYLPEELELDERLSGREFLAYVAGLKGLDNAAERAELLSYFHLEPWADRWIATYSHGMRKKIGLSAALMGNPRLVLLDEPLNGLDTESMRRLRWRIVDMTERGTSFILSSHVMSFVERLCQRMAILQRGRLVALGTAEQLRTQADLPGEPFEDVFLALALDESEARPQERTGSLELECGQSIE